MKSTKQSRDQIVAVWAFPALMMKLFTFAFRFRLLSGELSVCLQLCVRPPVHHHRMYYKAAKRIIITVYKYKLVIKLCE